MDHHDDPISTTSATLAGLVRPLVVPASCEPPTTLEHEGLRAHAITRHDLADDVAGINASLDLIRRTRGGGWPAGAVTADDNYVDLVWHELEFRERSSLTYVLRDTTGSYLGCAYLYPVGRRIPLIDHLDRDVDVSWWVTPTAHVAGYYTLAFRALQHWIDTAFPFTAPVFSNADIPHATNEPTRTCP